MNKKERILKTLKDIGRLSTARLAAIAAISYDNNFKKLLTDMIEEKLIVMEPETNAIYWRLKE